MEEHYALAYGSKLEFSTTTFTFVEKDDEQESKCGEGKTSLDAFTKGQRGQQKLREGRTESQSSNLTIYRQEAKNFEYSGNSLRYP
jgi:hypothetical protein